ncbi:DEAD/DEAH box helicase family protein [Candidatus Uhrbacteria bacterium]|nr:DEAD/DEAH box helicase family protein [Candidatus Uhrbacteria bacterium]
MDITTQSLHRAFTQDTPRPGQEAAIAHLAKHGSGLLEMPTGTGKTDVGIAYLRARRMAGAKGPLLYVTPTKAQVDQVCVRFPEARAMYGRNEHPCAYYHTRGMPMNAAEVPCATLCAAKLCPHQVDQETGETRERGAEPCSYFLQEYAAKHHDDVVVCTTAFFLVSFARAGDWPTLGGLVLDEVHRIASVARGIFSYEITDYALRRAMRALRSVGDRTNAQVLRRFLQRMRTIARGRPPVTPRLLEQEHLVSLLDILNDTDAQRIREGLQRAVRDGALDPIEDATTIRSLEDLVRNIPQYMKRLAYAVETEEDNARNFVYAYYRAGDLGQRRVRYHLIIQSYAVDGLIRKLVGKDALAMSATIGDPTHFRYEAGIKLPFLAVTDAPFPVDRSRIFLPMDAPDLSARAQSRDTLRKTIARIVDACAQFATAGHRTLVIVQSNAEREMFTRRAIVSGLDVITHGDGVLPKEAAARFKAGSGDVLVGTAANYGEGIDLPRQIAPVIFFLRPGYPNPNDPQAQFEQRHLKGNLWPVWQWRVAIEALQVRGRNIRTEEDIGVCIFVSDQFRRIVSRELPKWLEPAYRSTRTWDQCVAETIELLQ